MKKKYPILDISFGNGIYDEDVYVMMEKEQSILEPSYVIAKCKLTITLSTKVFGPEKWHYENGKLTDDLGWRYMIPLEPNGDEDQVGIFDVHDFIPEIKITYE